MRPAEHNWPVYAGEPAVLRATFRDGDGNPLALTGEWGAQARRYPGASDPVEIAVDTSQMDTGRLTLTVPADAFPARDAQWVYDLQGSTWGTVLAGPMPVTGDVTRDELAEGGSVTDLVATLGPDEVVVTASAQLGPQGLPGDDGEPGVVQASAPATYDPATQTVGVDTESPDGVLTRAAANAAFVAHDGTLEVGAIVRVKELGPPVVLEHSADPAGGGDGAAATAALGLSGVLAYDVPARAAGAVGDSDSGHAWTAERGTWAVTASGRLAATGLATDRAILLLPDVGARMANVEATLTGDARRTGQLSGGLVVAYIDATNYLYVTNSGSPALTIKQVVGGVETDLATANWNTGGNGQSVAMRLLGGMGGRSTGAGGRAVGSIKNYLLNAVSSVDITPYLSGVIRQGLISFDTDARFQDVAVRQAEYGT